MAYNVVSTISVRHILEMLALALVYFLTAKVGQLISVPPGNVTPLWIPSGIILAVVLLRGYWIWPGIWLGAFAGNVSAYIDLQSYDNILASLFAGSMNGIGDVAGTLIAAYLIRKYTQSRNPLHKSSHIVIFLMFGVILNASISATFGVTSLALASFIPWSDYSLIWSIWSIGDAVGVLMFTPLIMSFFSGNKSHIQRHRTNEVLGFTLVLTLTVMVCLELLDVSISDELPLFLVTPILIWSVLRLCEKITFISIVIVSFTSVFATSMGVGPFADDNTVNSLLELQMFIAVMSVTILMLNSVVREREKINKKLKRTYRDLENLVKERTQNLTDALDREQQLNSGLKQTTHELGLAQKQLLHSQKMESLGTLAGGIAHDFNNILNVIIGNADLAESKLEEHHPAHKNIETIVKSSSRAAELVKQILAFSRTKSENYTFICLNEVVGEAIKMVRSTIPSHINIDFQEDEKDLTIYGDSTQIHQILINLCTNAYHSMNNAEGLITITLTEADRLPEQWQSEETKCALLSVSDNGSGIPENIMERIFDPFFTTKDVGKGTGLGLSVVHTIMESHKGIIKVASVPEKGTTFMMYLPLVDKEIQVNQENDKSTDTNVRAPKYPAAISCVHNIMLVDDEEDILRLYEQYLSSQGYNVLSCSNPMQALKEFEQKSECIDLVITDQSMPEMTGKNLSAQILNIKPTTKIILTTGYSDMINEESAMEIGISRFLSKPVKLHDLQKAIQICLDMRE